VHLGSSVGERVMCTEQPMRNDNIPGPWSQSMDEDRGRVSDSAG